MVTINLVEIASYLNLTEAQKHDLVISNISILFNLLGLRSLFAFIFDTCFENF